MNVTKCTCCHEIVPTDTLADGLCETCEVDRLEREYDDDLQGDVDDYDY